MLWTSEFKLIRITLTAIYHLYVFVWNKFNIEKILRSHYYKQGSELRL